MIEQMKKKSVTDLDNIEICSKQIEQMVIDLDEDVQDSSIYLKSFRNNLNNLYAKTQNLNKTLSSYDVVLSKLSRTEEINIQIIKLKQELVISQEPELIINQINQLQEERMNLINQAKMISYE